MKVYSYQEINDIMKFMAKVVDRYLPIFERVQKELKKAEQRKTSLDLAKRIATKDTGYPIINAADRGI